jgi:hypothetical protein
MKSAATTPVVDHPKPPEPAKESSEPNAAERK